MTLTEVLLASTLLVVLVTLVAVTMSVITNVSGTVTSQYQEYDQALPAFAPLQKLLRAEVEPAAANGSGVPTPGFAQYSNVSLNFAVQFYSNIGTAYNNLTGAGTTAGPARIVAVEVDQNGSPVGPTTVCTIKSPCGFQVRRYLPIVNSGTSTCPVVTDGTYPNGTCQYPSAYTLITNASRVINNPSDLSTAIFSYSMFDPNWPAGANSPGTSFATNANDVQNNQITGLPYPRGNTQTLTACGAVNGNYPTTASACPLDAVQSVGVDLMVGVPGSGPNGTVDNQTIVYRYPPTGNGSTTLYPYQFNTWNPPPSG